MSLVAGCAAVRIWRDHLDEVTMIDFGTAKILSHRRNIQRCVTLLATELTELQRQYLHKRIAEERAELERLQGTQSDQAGAVIAQSPVNKKAHAEGVTAYAPTDKEREIVETAAGSELTAEEELICPASRCDFQAAIGSYG